MKVEPNNSMETNCRDDYLPPQSVGELGRATRWAALFPAAVAHFDRSATNP